MGHFESNLRNKKGVNFYVQGWEPPKRPKAVIALIHGFGEHTGRYEHVGEAFNKAGYILIGFDLRGHGKSEGVRGHASSYDALMEDITDFKTLVEVRYPNLPYFLYGHSMGGNLVLNYCLRCKPDVVGAIVTGPWLRLASAPPSLQVRLAKTINNIFPDFAQNSNLETAALSHDQNVVEAYDHDPLVHAQISVRLFVSIYESGLWALDHAEELSIPLLLMHGTADRITSFAASAEFAKASGKVTTWRPWDGFYHEIHNEPEKVDVIQAMIEWLDTHLKRK